MKKFRFMLDSSYYKEYSIFAESIEDAISSIKKKMIYKMAIKEETFVEVWSLDVARTDLTFDDISDPKKYQKIY